MFFRFISILFFILCFASAQTFHSRNIFMSSEIMMTSSRGNAMGNSGMMVDNNPFWAGSNPAALSELEGVQFSMNTLMHRYKEHRSIKVHDYFGDFLADASYVFNDDNYYYNSVAFSFPMIYDKITIGFSNLPFHDFSYNYIEEVHDASYDLNKDPLVGYHIEKISGLSYNLSYGLGWKIFNNFSFGLGFNQMHSGNKFLNSPIFLERIKSVVVLEESENLSSNESYADTITIKLKTSNFFSYGFLMSIKNNISFGFNYREPVYTMEANKLRYTIPSKCAIGILLQPRQEIPASIVFEYDMQKYSNIDSIFSNSVHLYDKKTYHCGIEYLNSESSIRVGMVYQNSPFQRDLDETIFTFGYGKNINSIIVDLAANYSTISYSYPDQFVPNGDISNPDQFEKVIESNMGISMSLTYNFR